MIHGVALVPKHGAEASRIAKTHRLAIAKINIEVIVLPVRGSAGGQGETAGHPKVDDQGAVWLVGILDWGGHSDQKIFSSAPHAGNDAVL